MDNSTVDLGEVNGTLGPGSLTAMETTLTVQERELHGAVPPGVDLSFLEKSARAKSLGKLGEFEITGFLGQGAMGIVLRGHDRSLSRCLAIKIQHPRIALDRRARARFLREARAAAAINHGNVVIIYHVNVLGNRPFLAMEYLGGGSLRQRIKEGPPLEAIETIRIAHQVASGLAAAHRQGLLHRDIKPANILLESGAAPRVKITDFGLAVAGLGRGVAVTPEVIVGTPAYMSPEQVRGEPLDARSDLFSLGTVIYAMVTGRSPFAVGPTAATLQAVREREVPPAHEVSDRCPRRLSDLVARLMKKDPDERPGSADEVEAELSLLLALANQASTNEDLPALPAPGTGPFVSPSDHATTGIDPEAENEADPEPITVAVRLKKETAGSRRRSKSLALLAALVLLVAGLGWAAYRRSQLTPPVSEEHVLTVASSGNAQFQTLASALANARPGDTIRIEDDATYAGHLVLDYPAQLAGLTIEAPKHAKLTAPGVDPILALKGVPGVRIRGLIFETRNEQFAIVVNGPSPGVTIEDSQFLSPPDSVFTQVWITEGASGTAEAPIKVLNSSFEVGHGGVTVQGSNSASVGFVKVIGNTFLGEDEHVHVLQDVHDVTVAFNRFLGGQGVTLNLANWDARNVVVMNNTFLRPAPLRNLCWLHPCESDGAQDGLVIANNLILEPTRLDSQDQGLVRMKLGKWQFLNNYYESPAREAHPEDAEIAMPLEHLAIPVRDPARWRDPAFLRPSAGSPLVWRGYGGAFPQFVGAVAPEGEPEPAPPAARP